MKRTIVVLAMMATTLTAHSTESDLIGTYAIKDKGVLKEFIRIEKREGGYVAAEKRADGWREVKEPLTPVTREQFDKLLKRKTDTAFDGLASKGTAVFKVPRGWQEGKFRTETGYFIFMPFGPIELHKL